MAFAQSTKTRTDNSSALRTLENPVAWFPFDGDFLDYSGNNYHGTNMNTTWATDRHGNPNKALSFNGSSSGVRLDNGYPPVFLGSLTFSCWVYFNDDSRGILFGSHNTAHNVNFEKYTGNKLRIYWDNGNAGFLTDPNVVWEDDWCFVTFTRDVDTDSFHIYVNGEHVETSPGAGSNISPAGPFYIGRDSREGSYVVNGKMDDIRIYGSALSDTEVLALYNEPDLLADFTADTTSDATPLTVNFNDISVLNLAPIAEWKWYFGDGDSSSVQNPVYTYEHSSDDMQAYTVTLKVKDENDLVSEITKEDYIQVFPPNYIAGGNVSGLWTAANSPYFVGGEIIVPFGDTLTIEPGVFVKFKTNSIDHMVQEPTPDNSDFGYMTIYGTLIAQGTVEDSICFTRAGDTGWWGMIHLTKDANPDNPIEYCKMDYASYMVIDPDNDKEIAGLSFDGMDGTVRNCSFYNNVYGICCDSSIAIISENTFSNNTMSGVFCCNSQAQIENNIISQNQQNGIYSSTFSHLVIADNIIQANVQNGICCKNDSTYVSGNTISENGEAGIDYYYSYSLTSGNTITGNGTYGIYYSHSFSTATGNEITDNTGRGIGCSYSDSVVIKGNTITGNQSNGIFCWHANPEINHNTITLNNSTAINAKYSTPQIISNIISINGGGISISESNPQVAQINNNTISFNNGDGVSCYWSADPKFNNNIINSNSRGISIGSDCNPNLLNNTIAENENYGVYCASGGSAAIENSILWDNADGSLHGNGITITWSCIQGGYAGEGNIDDDPMFIGTGDDPYALTWSNFPANDTTKSPCIDSGDPDLNGDGNDWMTDPDDRDPDESRMDMGAKYYHQAPRLLVYNNPDPKHAEYKKHDFEEWAAVQQQNILKIESYCCFLMCIILPARVI